MENEALKRMRAAARSMMEISGASVEVDLGHGATALALLLDAGGTVSTSDQSSVGVWWRKRWVTLEFDGVRFTAHAPDARLKMVEVDQ